MPQSVPISMYSNLNWGMEGKPPLCHLRIPKERVHHIKSLVTFSKLDKNNIIEGQQIYNSHKKGERRWHNLDLTIMKSFRTNFEDENNAWR